MSETIIAVAFLVLWVAIALAWRVVLPVVGLLWLAGYL